MSPLRPIRVTFPFAPMMKALVNTYCNDKSSAVLSIMCLCMCTHTRGPIHSLKYAYYPKVDKKINEKQYSYWI